MQVNSGRSVAFEVSYRLGEYLAFLRARVATVLGERASQPGRTPSKLENMLVWCVLSTFGSVAFLYKVPRVGRCRFLIDESEISRESRSGNLIVPWSDVVAVHRYPFGYLISKARGSLPVPLRVLSSEQQQTLEEIIATMAPVDLSSAQQA
jgi:hypothetical protein